VTGTLFLVLAVVWSPVAVLAVLLLGFTLLALVDLIGAGGSYFHDRDR
jgi:hypothetical protein